MPVLTINTEANLEISQKCHYSIYIILAIVQLSFLSSRKPNKERVLKFNLLADN